MLRSAFISSQTSLRVTVYQCLCENAEQDALHALCTICFFSISLFLQDEKLKKLVEQHGTDSWKLIATLFPVSTIV